MSRNKNITQSGVIYLGRRRSNRAHWVFIAIIVFIVILVPIYGTTLRYDVSISLRLLFSAIGEMCLSLGIPLIILTFLFSLFSKHLYFKTFILAIVLLWIGAFLTDTQFSLFGYLFGQHTPSQGYH